MKKWLFFLGLFPFFILQQALAAPSSTSSSQILFFYGQGCPHCAAVETYFEQNNLYGKYPIVRKEVYFNSENAQLFTKTMQELGVPADSVGVPTIVMGDKVITGDTPIIKNFVTDANAYLGRASPSPAPAITPAPTKPDLTLAAVIGASLVDAINPCAFAVLIILMTTIIASGDAKKALFAGLAFSTSIFISYFLMGIGIYKVLTFGSLSLIFFRIVGILAIILGLFNLKDYFWYGKGFLMEVPLSWRPSLKGLIKSVTNPLGAFFVGFLVSLFLLPCTSGPYIVILGMMARKSLQTQAIMYLLLYNLIFVSPMLVITLAVYKGFSPEKAEEMRLKRLRLLHLIAGVIMLAMGAVILLGWV